MRHATLEAAYLAIVRQGLQFPPIFLDQLVQLILRNMLDDCDDAFVLRAAVIALAVPPLWPLFAMTSASGAPRRLRPPIRANAATLSAVI